MFDESTSWYLLLPPISHDSIPSSEEEVSEAEMPRVEGEIRAPGKSLISFRLTGSNEGLSLDGQSSDEPASSGDSVMLSLRKEPGRRFTREEKGKKKIADYDFGHVESDRNESDSEPIKKEPPQKRLKSAKKAMKSANEQLRRSAHLKNPVKRYGYNEYMAHHYAYMRT